MPACSGNNTGSRHRARATHVHPWRDPLAKNANGVVRVQHQSLMPSRACNSKDQCQHARAPWCLSSPPPAPPPTAT
eukprot:457545-Rhodomonas_salina.1